MVPKKDKDRTQVWVTHFHSISLAWQSWHLWLATSRWSNSWTSPGETRKNMACRNESIWVLTRLVPYKRSRSIDGFCYFLANIWRSPLFVDTSESLGGCIGPTTSMIGTSSLGMSSGEIFSMKTSMLQMRFQDMEMSNLSWSSFQKILVLGAICGQGPGKGQRKDINYILWYSWIDYHKTLPKSCCCNWSFTLFDSSSAHP